MIAVPIPGQDNSLSPDVLADIVRRVGMPAEGRDSIEAALAAAARLDPVSPPRILITGSLYLAGEVLALNGTMPN